MTMPGGPTGGGGIDYNSIPADPTSLGVGSSSTKNPNDVWSLGALYGQPVALGTKNVPAPAEIDPSTGRPLTGGVTQQLDLSHSTQEIVTGLNKMWASQAEERKKDPNAPTSYEQFQQEMWLAGFYGQTTLENIHLGQWDPATMSALRTALGEYESTVKSGTPVTWSEFLATNAQASQNAKVGFYSPGSNPYGGSSKSTTQPQLSVTDPTAIRDAAQTAAMSALGHGLDENQLAAFVTQFQESQKQAEQSKASTVSAPDLSAQADLYAQTASPADFSAYQDDKYMNTLMNMFLPAESSRPNLGQVTPRLE